MVSGYGVIYIEAAPRQRHLRLLYRVPLPTSGNLGRIKSRGARAPRVYSAANIDLCVLVRGMLLRPRASRQGMRKSALRSNWVDANCTSDLR